MQFGVPYKHLRAARWDVVQYNIEYGIRESKHLNKFGTTKELTKLGLAIHDFFSAEFAVWATLPITGDEDKERWYHLQLDTKEIKGIRGYNKN
jgi:hypothetical protein